MPRGFNEQVPTRQRSAIVEFRVRLKLVRWLGFASRESLQVIVEDPEFELPDGDAVVWRYLDLAKYVAMLQRGTLFFARADQLGDPFEGSYGIPNIAARPQNYSHIPDLSLQTLSMAHESSRYITYVNCWHHNQHESEAMWKLYATENRGIALCSSVGALRASLTGTERICLGCVRYIDYRDTSITEGDPLLAYMYKRRSFVHEQEVRAVMFHIAAPHSFSSRPLNAPPSQPLGIEMQVDLSKLLDRVIVSPFAEDWFVEVVGAASERYDLDVPIGKSELADKPNW